MRIYRFDDYINHLLEQVRSADNSFSFKRQQFRNDVKSGKLPNASDDINGSMAAANAEIYDIAADKLSLEQVELTFYLKKYSPGFIMRFWIKKVRHLDPDFIYDIGNKNKYTFPVTVTIKRSSAFTVLTKEQDPEETGKIHVRM